MYSGILQSLEKDILITMEENPFILAIVLVYAQAAQWNKLIRFAAHWISASLNINQYLHRIPVCNGRKRTRTQNSTFVYQPEMDAVKNRFNFAQ